MQRIYKPPGLNDQRIEGKTGQKRARHAKLWLVNLKEYSLPKSEVKRYEQGQAKAEKRVKNRARSTTESFHWPSKPRIADELELGDWVIQATTYRDKSIVVSPPGQLLIIDHYVRVHGSGNDRWVFHIEVPRRGETMTWAKFRRAARVVLGEGKLASPRTRPIRDVQAADHLLGLWTPGGRVARG